MNRTIREVWMGIGMSVLAILGGCLPGGCTTVPEKGRIDIGMSVKAVWAVGEASEPTVPETPQLSPVPK